MEFQFNDGGRSAAGYKGTAGDCVTRAIAIALELPYQTVYDKLNHLAKMEKARPVCKGSIKTRRSQARNGVARETYDRLLKELGWQWTPTMKIGSGCTVHLCKEELPAGHIIVRVSGHVLAVIDGVAHDTYLDHRDGTRCVYGYYWKAAEGQL